jgi:rhodanese-related sulfurtransferase
MNRNAILLGVVGWLAASSFLSARNDAAPVPPATPANQTIVSNVTPAEAEKLIKDTKGLVVLDIRTPPEFAAGHIAGATNVDYYAAGFAAALAKLDKSKPYLVHCASGSRSTKSLEQFKKLNFQTVYHLDSGMKGWEKAGKPVQK